MISCIKNEDGSISFRDGKRDQIVEVRGKKKFQNLNNFKKNLYESKSNMWKIFNIFAIAYKKMEKE